MPKREILPRAQDRRSMRLSESGMDDVLFVEILDDFKSKLEREWSVGRRAFVKRLMQARSEDLIRMSRTRELENRIIYCDSHPIGILSYKVDNSVISLRFFHLHSRFIGQNLERDVIDHLVKTFFADPSIMTLYVCIPIFCRFAHDDEILHQFGFRGQHWIFMFLDLEKLQEQPQDITGYSLVPWNSVYRKAVGQLDVEARMVLDMLESQGDEGGIHQEASIVAMQGSEVCGAVLVQHAAPFIEYIVVSESHGRKGLGRALLTRALCMLKATGSAVVGGECYTENKSALSLLRSVGFSSCTQRALGYGLHRNAVNLITHNLCNL